MTPASDTAPSYRTAAALALGAAVSLGLARFSYALLLPLMRADLGWTYFTAGAMNTVNAAGYLAGALMAPRWLARHDARRVMLWGMAVSAALLALHATTSHEGLLFVLRGATGVASAASFVSGGLLAARLGAALAGKSRQASSLVLGLFYGGTGLGIVASSLLVPMAQAWGVAWAPVGSGAAPGWRWAWLALALAAVACVVVAQRGTRALASLGAPAAKGAAAPFDWRVLRFGLAAYLMFGLGYIGYMTFIITLLREQGLGASAITLFYVTLGLGVVASPWVWAGLLQRHRGGVPITVLNALLALATVLPVLSSHPVVVFASGALFGGVFLQVVASTTAMVRHNIHPAAWGGGIAAFTIIFAVGQIVGPTLVGWIADGAGGLSRGFAVSAAVLAFGAGLGMLQRGLPKP